MKKILLILLLAFLPVRFALAQAANCLPFPAPPSNGWQGTKLYSGVSKNGAWVWWLCFKQGEQTMRYEYVGTVAELSKVGGRLQTIINAADPLKSLNTAGSRFTILPLTDPSLAAVVADMRAAQATP